MYIVPATLWPPAALGQEIARKGETLAEATNSLLVAREHAVQHRGFQQRDQLHHRRGEPWLVVCVEVEKVVMWVEDAQLRLDSILLTLRRPDFAR